MRSWPKPRALQIQEEVDRRVATEVAQAIQEVPERWRLAQH
ncbi:hypothetical protein [Salinisphaera sp. SWV1]